MPPYFHRKGLMFFLICISVLTIVMNSPFEIYYFVTKNKMKH